MIGRDLLGIEDLERGEIERILETAEHMQRDRRSARSRRSRRCAAARSSTCSSSPSTRTRDELRDRRQAALGRRRSTSRRRRSSTDEGRDASSTRAQTLDAMDADAVVVRHEVAGVPKRIADVLDAPVINAGDGAHEHPTQALLDCFTVRAGEGPHRRPHRRRSSATSCTRASRARTSTRFRKLGAEVRVAAPPTMMPAGIEALGVKAVHVAARGARRRRRGDGAAHPERAARRARSSRACASTRPRSASTARSSATRRTTRS